ncbi:MAG: regulatory protein RecX [Dehalococcoidia bacterium]
MIVTAVERPTRRRRVNVFVDGQFAVALSLELAAERDVRAGRSLTKDDITALAEEEARRGALQAALRLVARGPRSERELRDRLRRRGFAQPAVDAAAGRLQELGYLDDAAFARFWTETRQAGRPSSQRFVVSELRRKGIAPETAQEATAEISDEEAAYDAASRRLRSFQGLEYQRFRERLGAFLTRRGFGYDVARRTIERCWAEVSDEEAASG